MKKLDLSMFSVQTIQLEKMGEFVPKVYVTLEDVLLDSNRIIIFKN